MLRIGIAGVGGLGRVHLASYLSHPQARVVALADPLTNRRLAELEGVEFNIATGRGEERFEPERSYEDYRDLCEDPELDVVSICLPTDLHCDAAIRAFEHGKHVFCEKPMALRAEDGRRMIDAARSADRTLMIGHCLRFWPEYLVVEEAIRDERFGPVVAASFARICNVPKWGMPDNWFVDMARSGGPVIDLHVHDADLCVAWWGRPEAVSVGGMYLGDVPGLLHSRWRYPNGLSIQFETGWEARRSALFYYAFKITFEEATLMFDSRSGKGLQLAAESEPESVEVEPGSAYVAQDHYFLDCLTAGVPVDRCPAEQSLASLECVGEEAGALASCCSRPWPL